MLQQCRRAAECWVLDVGMMSEGALAPSDAVSLGRPPMSFVQLMLFMTRSTVLSDLDRNTVLRGV